jgi:hypothetical protein
MHVLHKQKVLCRYALQYNQTSGKRALPDLYLLGYYILDKVVCGNPCSQGCVAPCQYCSPNGTCTSEPSSCGQPCTSGCVGDCRFCSISGLCTNGMYDRSLGRSINRKRQTHTHTHIERERERVLGSLIILLGIVVCNSTCTSHANCSSSSCSYCVDGYCQTSGLYTSQL